MTDNPRVRLYQLACEAACLIATAPDPAQARQRFLDDLTEELLAGAVNLAGSQALLSAFRDAMGYSVRVPDDGLGERGDKPHAGGAIAPRSPSPLRVVEEGDAR